MSAVLFAVLLAASSSTSYLEIEGSSSGGAISGKITYAGKPPTPAKLNVTMDQRYCGATREEDAWLVTQGGVASWSQRIR